MKRDMKIVGLLVATLVVALVGCGKESLPESTPAQAEGTIGFAAAAQDEGLAGRASDTSFDDGDNIGVYAYYNYYYTDGAESALFENQLVTYNASGITYSPSRVMTFSTVYGDAPHHLTVIGYYPYELSPMFELTDYMVDSEGVRVSQELQFTYDSAYFEDFENHADVMVAQSEYKVDYDAGATDAEVTALFREYMMGLDYTLSLSFSRILGGVKLDVTPVDAEAATQISAVSIAYTDAPTQYVQYAYNSGGVSGWNTEQTTSGVATHTFSTPVTPASEEWGIFYLPPGSNIASVTFTHDGGATSWHPHIEAIEANRIATITIEFDTTKAY